MNNSIQATNTAPIKFKSGVKAGDVGKEIDH